MKSQQSSVIGPTKAKQLCVNIGILVSSTILFLLACELVVFRIVLPGSDVPSNAFVDDVVRYDPNQIGIWRVRNEIRAPYAINAQGWNSGSGDYVVDRKPGVMRVAVVGDSFVEALQVRYDRSLGEHIGRHLSALLNRPVEVYRFGMSGAPLSQYVHMIQREVARYQPDWIVVLLIHNDFDESFEFVSGRYTSSFLKLKIDNAMVVSEIPPTPWRPGAADFVRRTAHARFFYYRWQVRSDTLRNVFVPIAQAATSAEASPEHSLKMLKIEAATEYLFRRLSAASRLVGGRLLLTMDGDRAAIYATRAEPGQQLNRIAATTAQRLRLPYLDLHPHFLADWQQNGLRFHYLTDHHWNERGHAVAGLAIAQAMQVTFDQGR